MANTGDILLRNQANFDDVMGTSVWLMGVGVALRQPVKVDPANDSTVIPCLADGLPEEPCIGIISTLNSPSPGYCLVRTLGFVDGFAGLTRGKQYLLGRSVGTLVAADDTVNPDYPQIGTSFKQTLGVARSATSLFVNVDPTTFDI